MQHNPEDAREKVLQVRLGTYNIGGGRKDFGSQLEAVTAVVRESAPDILALQESVEWQEADTTRHSVTTMMAEALGGCAGAYFEPILSMQKHFHPRRVIFVHGLFNDWLDWKHGNALLTRWPSVRLGNPGHAGVPYNVPLFRPARYEGNRDTEPRYALLARLACGPVAPFVIGTHLSTLVGERGGPEREIPGKADAARALRLNQIQNLLAVLREHVLARNELVFLLGDFNATADEPCLAELERAGFVRLVPEQKNVPTHLFKVAEPIDHIFVYPASRLCAYKCWIVDTPLARQASDHLPVMADISVV